MTRHINYPTPNVVLSSSPGIPPVPAVVAGPTGPANIDFHTPDRLAIGGDEHAGTHLFAALPPEVLARLLDNEQAAAARGQSPVVGFLAPAMLPEHLEVTGTTSAVVIFDDRSADTGIAVLVPTEAALNMHQPGTLWFCLNATGVVDPFDDLTDAVTHNALAATGTQRRDGATHDPDGPGAGLGPVITGVVLPNFGALARGQ